MVQISNRWIAVGALVGAAGVAIGAFGAHGLPDELKNLGYAEADLARRLSIFETATRYQMYHALALVLTGLLLDKRPARAWQFGCWAFLAGILLFSGLLYIMTIAPPQWNWLGAIVPIGGLAFIIGWLAIAIGAFRNG